MATTSPDTLWSPDPTGNYNLVADLATMQTSNQAALVKRANMYVGTSAQRTAFTTAPEGVHWQDTNGTKLQYVRKAGAWVTAVGETTAWTTLTGWTGGFTNSNDSPVQYRKVGDMVQFRGSAVNTSWSGGLTQFNTVPAGFRPPSGFRHFPVAVNSTVSRTVYIRADGALFFYGSAASGAAWSLDSAMYSTTP